MEKIIDTFFEWMDKKHLIFWYHQIHLSYLLETQIEMSWSVFFTENYVIIFKIKQLTYGWQFWGANNKKTHWREMARFMSLPISILSCNVIGEEIIWTTYCFRPNWVNVPSVNKGGTSLGFWLLSFRDWHDTSFKLASGYKGYILFYFQGYKRNGIIYNLKYHRHKYQMVNLWTILERENFSMPHHINTGQISYANSVKWEWGRGVLDLFQA